MSAPAPAGRVALTSRPAVRPDPVDRADLDVGRAGGASGRQPAADPGGHAGSPGQEGRDRAPDRGRVAGLDGLRGLAALYVVVFHCWLFNVRGFPANRGPA
ncbi:MAG: hypothetical protein V7637_6559, partial [Mycobacteriales bacterium]